MPSALFMTIFSLCTLFAFSIAQAERPVTIRALDDSPAIHFILQRRGGALNSKIPETGVANFTYLKAELDRIEARYGLTKREVHGNKLVRKARTAGVGGNEMERLMGEVGEQGRW
jgi:hypothetical protein